MREARAPGARATPPAGGRGGRTDAQVVGGRRQRRKPGPKSLADAPRAASVTQTDVYTVLDQQANDEVRKVIAANLGRGAKTNVHAAAKAGQGV